MLPYYEKVSHDIRKIFSPLEFLISLKVDGFNGDWASDKFDTWSIALIFIIVEGYPLIYK